MASRGRSKLSKTETKFGDKTINLPRFAYDYFVYSALKFQVPSSCIAAWEGPENDYGCERDEFCLTMSRLVFRHQLGLRISLHERFMIEYDLEKLTSFRDIANLLQDVFTSSTREFDHQPMDFIRKAVITLAVASEMIIFLYSKNCDLYFKELANYWFTYFPHMSKQLGKAGGLEELYSRCDLPNKAKWASFMNDFIKLNCLPYEASLKNKFLENFYEFISKYESGLAAIVDLKLSDNRGILQVESMAFPSGPKKSAPPLSHTPDKASKMKTTKNTGLGIRPHEELLRDIVADDAAPSQNLPQANTQEQGRRRRRTSTQEKVKRGSRLRDDATRIEVLENTGLGISPHEDLLRGVVADDVTPSQNPPDKKPREKARWRRRTSTLEKAETSLRVGEDSTRTDTTGLGIRPHEDLLRDVGASVADEAAPSQNFPAANPQELAGWRRPSTQQNVKTSLCLKEDATKIDRSENTALGSNPLEELLLKANVSAADYTSPSQDLLGLCRLDADRLSSQTQKSKFSFCLGVKEGFGKYSRGSSRPKQASSEMLDVLVTGGTTLGLNRPLASYKEPATPSEVLSNRQIEEFGSTSDFEQGFGLDSSGTELSSMKPDISANDGETESRNLSGVHQQESERSQEGSFQEQGASSLPSVVEQGLEKLSLDSSGTELSSTNPDTSAIDGEMAFQNVSGVHQQDLERSHEGSFQEQGLPSVVEQGLGKLSPDSSKSKEEEPNVSETDDSTPSEPGTSPEDPASVI